MTITVSISQFRQNISDYLEMVKAGNIVILKDEKKDDEVAEIVGKKRWNPQAFERALRRVAGTFTAKNHPEWRTKKDVTRWLTKTRKAAERTFTDI
ncbi:hypothetical protein HY030_00420 [Candidatus Gottesmanbacteria bacterium]|nr:hypothetical protein [Candidatus Gottesmanbacteria bacterium]